MSYASYFVDIVCCLYKTLGYITGLIRFYAVFPLFFFYYSLNSSNFGFFI